MVFLVVLLLVNGFFVGFNYKMLQKFKASPQIFPKWLSYLCYFTIGWSLMAIAIDLSALTRLLP
jgi:uncharacterized membrane protein YczE